jgi:aspartate/glutamate racemase
MFDRLGVDVIVPNTEEIEQIHNTYMDVLQNRSTPTQIDGLRQVARTLIARDGTEAVQLAGTDLSMVLNEEDAGFPTIDCAATHITCMDGARGARAHRPDRRSITPAGAEGRTDTSPCLS